MQANTKYSWSKRGSTGGEKAQSGRSNKSGKASKSPFAHPWWQSSMVVIAAALAFYEPVVLVNERLQTVVNTTADVVEQTTAITAGVFQDSVTIIMQVMCAIACGSLLFSSAMVASDEYVAWRERLRRRTLANHPDATASAVRKEKAARRAVEEERKAKEAEEARVRQAATRGRIQNLLRVYSTGPVPKALPGKYPVTNSRTPNEAAPGRRWVHDRWTFRSVNNCDILKKVCRKAKIVEVEYDCVVHPQGQMNDWLEFKFESRYSKSRVVRVAQSLQYDLGRLWNAMMRNETKFQTHIRCECGGFAIAQRETGHNNLCFHAAAVLRFLISERDWGYIPGDA